MTALAHRRLTDAARSIFAGGLAACSVEQAVRTRLVACNPGGASRVRLPDGDEIDLSDMRRILVIAVGKGAATMLHALLATLRLAPGCSVEGILIAPAEPPTLPDGFQFFAGGHPLPTAESLAGATAALSLLASAAEDARAGRTFCFFLISGGASSMMELPLDPAILIEETRAFHRALVHSGASIADINCVRKHFSAVKGGRLGIAAKSLLNVTLLVSDVPTGHLDALGSGPTLPDRSTVAQCREILARFELLPQLPGSVRDFFTSERLRETPKAETLHARFDTLLCADDLAAAARARAESLGFFTVIDNTCDDWDFAAAADYLLGRLRSLRQAHGRVCLISVGEVTVRVPAVSQPRSLGQGGRNQHLALYAATQLRGFDYPVVLLSAGSDGIDGNSIAAGAIVDGDTLRDSPAFAEAALARFDSFTLLHQLGATIVTGPTGNNLRDLRVLLTE